MALDVSRRRRFENRRAFPLATEQLEQRLLLSAATFGSPVNTQIITGLFPIVGTTTGDLNGDGIPDLVVNRSDLTAQVFIGTATGAFNLSNIFPSGGQSIALGDFNGDGNLDLATANGVLPGNGAGGFGMVVPGFTLPANAVNLYAEPLTTSGNLDLVVSTFVNGSGTGANANPSIGLSVLLGNGNGTFGAPISTTVGRAANLSATDAAFAFADFNSDGLFDAVSEFGVMLSKGDGTFSAPVPFPSKSAGSTTPTTSAAPLFAIGDFNGDGNQDIVTLPAVSNPGFVELFLGNGDGTFRDSGAISVGATDTITSLDADILVSGNTTADLIAGIKTSTGAAELAVLSNSGTATFSAPALYAISGPSVAIATGDFNGDTFDDLISINQPLGGTGTGTIEDAVAADVLINSPQTLPAPVLGLRASANPIVTDAPVTFTAVVRAPANSPSGAAAPTGNVTFEDGTASLGTQTLVKGQATVTFTESTIGYHSISFVYGGDSNYALATSATVPLRVLLTLDKVPVLVPTLGTVTFPSEFLAGDRGTASVTLTNGGAAAGRGKVDVNFYLSPDGAIDSSAIPLSIPALQNRPVNIASGRAVTLTGTFKAGKYPSANYQLVAQVVPVVGLTVDQIMSTPLVSATSYLAAGLVFGTVGVHRGLRLKIADSAGNLATFSIAGSGLGTITQTGGNTDLVVTGTSKATTLAITSHGPFTLNNVHISGTINSFSGRFVTLAGNMTVTGGIRQLTLASAGNGAATAIKLGGALPVIAALGNVADVTLTAAGSLSSVNASSWEGGAIDAASIASLVVRGDFSADLQTHGHGKLQSARLGSVTGGTWAVAGGIGLLRISGSISGADIYAGADTGPDDLPGTADDVFAAATIASLYIGGSDTSTLILAGASSFAAGTDTTGLTLLKKGSILAVTVLGAVSDDSRFLAAHVPRIAKLAGTRIATAGDPHFSI